VLKFVLVVALLGALVYLTVRIIERRGIKPTPRPQPRPFGPDDDPDFLWDLDRKKRHPEKRPEDPDAPV
jgi:hypothetical protein